MPASEIIRLVARQAADNATSTAASSSSPVAAKPTCGGGALDPSARFNVGLHIGALFIILATSTFGAFFPVLSKRVPALKIPNLVFVIAKFFGSGVIIATAFIHMLPSAFESLSDPCLPDFWINQYTAAPGAIAMTASIIIFLVEYGSTRYLAQVDRKVAAKNIQLPSPPASDINNGPQDIEAIGTAATKSEELPRRPMRIVQEPNGAHFGHHHIHPAPIEGETDPHTAATQKLGVAILEAGIIFHSVFIGLTLAVSTGKTFEGLALGSRIATLSFRRRDWRPYVMALAYACTTPLGIAVGLGVRLSYDPSSQRALITSGIFDAVSAGLLIYAAMVELLAHDFIHGEMRTAPAKQVFLAIASLLVGCALMALLGRWA